MIQTRVQTELIIPGICPNATGDSHAKYIPKLEQLIAALGIHLKTMEEFDSTYEPNPGEKLWGYSDLEKQNLYIDRTMPPNAILATEVHELGHFIQPMGLSLDGQVYAESFAYLVCKRLGLDLSPNSLPYIAQFKYAGVLQRWSKNLNTDVDALVRELK